jgi:two-component system, NarL family, capsular synthesis sensor histidine kinase RcsC
VRLIATELARSELQRTAQGWEVNAYDIRAIGKAVMQIAQGGEPEKINSNSQQYTSLELSALVVEDNPINREILREQLVALGVHVTLAEDGGQALMRWCADLFDVVITDVNMPNMDGYELARRLRKLGFDSPIIGVTANALREEGEQCLEAGMNAWLVKPLSISTLHQTLVVHCHKTRIPVLSRLHNRSSIAISDDLEGWITLSPAMHNLFITTMEEDLDKTELALREKNTPALIDSVHRIHGSFATVCAVALAAACDQCETALRRDSLSSESAKLVEILLQRGRAVVLRLAGGELYPQN